MNPPPSGKPTGPVPMLDDAEARQKVLSVLSLGGSLNDAADFLKIDRNTLYRYRLKHPEFELDIRHAEAAGKLKHLKNLTDAAVGTAPEEADWKASAHFLACKYPEQWSQKAKVDVSHRGTVELDVDVAGSIDLTGFEDDVLLRLETAIARARGGTEGTG